MLNVRKPYLVWPELNVGWLHNQAVCPAWRDIGGTFTDVVLEVGTASFSTKVLTIYIAPANVIFDGMQQVSGKAGITPSQIDQIIHGTTLATNALIERPGAKIAAAGYESVAFGLIHSYLNDAHESWLARS